MAEYIEREAAKLHIFEYGVRHRDNSSISFACENLERQMNTIPAADVRPVVRGEWEYKGDFTYHCSVCDKNIYTPRLSPYNFCPHCGADMREVGRSG